MGILVVFGRTITRGDMPAVDIGALYSEQSMQSRNARIGLVLFILYTLIYGGFVLLNAFAPDIMETTPLAGVNLAILYGMGLIILALMLAIVYGIACGRTEEKQ
jgi:uncharacterized membrane protein (DUF485 family)